MSGSETATANAQAGPSHSPQSPTQEELNRIAASLAHRDKRKASILTSASSKAGKAKRNLASRIPLPPQLRRHDSDDEGYEGLSEDEIIALEQQKYTKRQAAAWKEIEERPPAIDIQRLPQDREESQAGQGEKQEYVWDVLFENQRGIYLLGKAYFSSRTLLPADPSAFTQPSHPLPSASSFTIARPTSDRNTTSQAERHVQSKDSAKNARGYQKITTSYTLDTFQTPSPAWEWLTPWMTNMRIGTDESGWRYNYCFRSSGWKSHAGVAGWGGWVRRREWVRLRCLVPEEVVDEGPKEPEENIDAQEGLGEIMKRNNVDGIIKALAKIPLDRKKLETWENWLSGASTDEREKLRRILIDEDNLHAISRSFTHHSSMTSLKTVLADHNIRLTKSDDTPSSSSAHLPSTPRSGTSGYDVPQGSPPRSKSKSPSRLVPSDTTSTSPERDTDD